MKKAPTKKTKTAFGARKRAKKKFTPKAIKVVRSIDDSIATKQERIKVEPDMPLKRLQSMIRKEVRDEVRRALRARG